MPQKCIPHLLALTAFAGLLTAEDSPTAQDARINALERRIAELENQVPSPKATKEQSSPISASTTGSNATNGSPDPLASVMTYYGRQLPGNVYVGDQFRIQLGGSLRLHTQYNSTAVGESVSKALLPSETNSQEDNFRMFASRTRLYATIQGPDTLGGQTAGYFEIDFQRQTSDGEGGAISSSPRLRYAYMRWSFKDVITDSGKLRFTFGQADSTWDLKASTVDTNDMNGGLGSVNRRNPRLESVISLTIASGQDLVMGLGVERPYFGNSTVGKDLGPGDLSGFPAVSLGLGYATTERLGHGFGAEKITLGARVVYGEFDEDFSGNATNPSLVVPAQLENDFTAIAVHGGINIQRLGFNSTGNAGNVTLMIGGVWSQGDAQHLDAGFDRRTVQQADGSLKEAHSVGGFIQPIYYLTETINFRAAFGTQVALNDDRPAATGNFTGGDYVRHTNEQFELSAWWTPGPFTFAVAWNHTDTVWRRVDPTSLAAIEQTGTNDKFELITWYTF